MAKKWPMDPARELRLEDLPPYLLLRVRKVRIDCSGLSFDQLRSSHAVVSQLVDIWSITDNLISTEIFIPPDYDRLPEIKPHPSIEFLFEPLLSNTLLRHKVSFDATDFSGNVTYEMHALLVGVINQDEGLVDFIFQQTHDTIKRKGLGNTTPWEMAICLEKCGHCAEIAPHREGRRSPTPNTRSQYRTLGHPKRDSRGLRDDAASRLTLRGWDFTDDADSSAVGGVVMSTVSSRTIKQTSSSQRHIRGGMNVRNLIVLLTLI